MEGSEHRLMSLCSICHLSHIEATLQIREGPSQHLCRCKIAFLRVESLVTQIQGEA